MLGLLEIRAIQHMKFFTTPIKFIHPLIILVLIPIVTNLVPLRSAMSESENPDIPQEGFVQLENDVDLVQLIKTVSEINNEIYILDESVKPQDINIITPEGGMKKEDFLKFFDVILNMNGLSVVKSDGMNKVIDSNRIKEESTPTIIELGE
ncbi:MAG: hypothetical protein DHS20C13_19310 [Thermodesulfobacteriota bacterium]|nr:MAG: hypothetical protein DHS20C13_19310 [Thermodesulfobacteriota bacterium]